MLPTPENPEALPLEELVILLRARIARLVEQLNNIPLSPVRPLLAAVHSLHEQAHGETPMRTCRSFPCRDLGPSIGNDLRGPAPTSFQGGIW